MHFPVPDFPFQRLPDPPAVVTMVSRSDVMWNRPVFKAPPIAVTPPTFDAKAVAEELRRGLRADR